MAYVKNYGGNWQTGVAGATPITEGALDNLETQWDEAVLSIAAHAALTATHGVAGAIVGTTDAQSLSNKTLGNALILNGQDFDAGAGNAKIITTGGGKGLEVEVTNNAATGAYLSLIHDSASPAINDYITAFRTWARDGDSPAVLIPYFDMYTVLTNVTDTTEAAKIEFWGYTAGASNLAMTLAGAGAVEADSTITGDAFDEFDDALILRRGISEGQLKVLQQLGVMRRKKRKEGGSGWMINFQKMMYLLAGGVYQTRARLDSRFTELDKRLGKLELALPEGR